MQERNRSPALPRARPAHAGAPAPGPRHDGDPGDERRQSEGLAVAPDALARLQAAQVRCPHCNKLLADQLHGTFTTVCVRCKKRVTITR